MRVQDVMSTEVVTIGPRQTLAEVHRIMNAEGVRHLPVVEGGQLLGLLTQRDLHLVETLDAVEPEEVLVDEVMVRDVYAVDPDAPLAEVLREMERRRVGSAVVLRERRPVGIFTTSDALRALRGVLEEQEERAGAGGTS